MFCCIKGLFPAVSESRSAIPLGPNGFANRRSENPYKQNDEAGFCGKLCKRETRNEI